MKGEEKERNVKEKYHEMKQKGMNKNTGDIGKTDKRSSKTKNGKGK